MTHVSLAQWDPTSRLVVQTVLRDGPLSRVAVSRRTGLSSGSLTRLTTPLVEAGILKEGASLPAPVGRPTLPLEAVDAAGRFVGVKVVRGRLHAVMTGLCGIIHGAAVQDADTASASTVADAVAELLRRHDDWRPEAIGVSLGAAVDPFGTVRAATFLGWSGGNITSAVTSATGVPCAAANDVDALTLAEHWFGHGRGSHNFVVITVGTGVGAGAVVEDRLLVGHQGSAGMLGAAWSRDGRTLHQVLSTDSLLERASAAAGRPLEPQDLQDEPDPGIAAVLDEAAGVLGEVVGLAKLVWGPERVLVTGDGVAPFARRRALIEAGMLRHQFYDIEPPQLDLGAELDFDDWARGAATLAIRATLTR